MKYQLRDLLEDESFINWVHQADSDALIKWNLYFWQHPPQQSLLEEAAFIVRGIRFAPKPVNPERVGKQWRQLQQRLRIPPEVYEKPVPGFWQSSRYLAGLVGGLLLGIIGYSYFKLNEGSRTF